MIVQPLQPISIVRDQIDATGMPAANTHTSTLWKNGATTAEPVTRTNPATGVYKFVWTIPADAAENDVFSLRVVDGDGYASTVWEAQVGVRAELDPATRVKLDATQPDYAPATPAQVNAQVLDVLSVDTFGELGSPPAATSSLKDKLVWLFMWARNKSTATATERKLYADDVTTIVSTETITDNGTTFTKGESL